MKFIQLTSLFISMVSSYAFSEDNYAWPSDQLVLQHAGEIGFISIGVAEKFRKNTLSHELLFGYVPQQLAGQRSIYTISNKISYLQNSDNKLAQLYVGANIFYVLNVAENTIKESYYRHNEYPMNSLHLMPYVGANFLFLNHHMSALVPYFEIGILNNSLESYVLNRKTISPTTIFTFSLGVRWDFNDPK